MITVQHSTYFLAGQAVATRIYGDPDPDKNGLFFLHSDHPSATLRTGLGSNSFMTYGAGHTSGTAGALVPGTLARYLPFGDWRAQPFADLTDIGFTGHKGNNNIGGNDIGLIYMNARFYLPGANRFLSADTIVPDPTSPQSYNRYTYSYNNPLRYIDPTGHNSDEPWIPDGTGCDPSVQSCESVNGWYLPPQLMMDHFVQNYCISLGSNCPDDIKFLYFGIPSTDAQWTELIAKKATTLCNSGGTCSIRQVKIHVNIITLGLSGIVSGVSNGIGWIGTFFNGGVAALGTNEPLKNTAMVGIKKGIAEGTGYVGRELNLNNVPLYKAPLSSIGIGMDLLKLPADVDDYIPVAAEQVALQVSQAEAGFTAAHWSTLFQPGQMSVERPYSTGFTGPWNPNYAPDTNWQWMFTP